MVTGNEGEHHAQRIVNIWMHNTLHVLQMCEQDTVGTACLYYSADKIMVHCLLYSAELAPDGLDICEGKQRFRAQLNSIFQ